jgi:hypothetical protein
MLLPPTFCQRWLLLLPLPAYPPALVLLLLLSCRCRQLTRASRSVCQPASKWVYCQAAVVGMGLMMAAKPNLVALQSTHGPAFCRLISVGCCKLQPFRKQHENMVGQSSSTLL